MDQISNEIFNILKGANYKLRLFTLAGAKTLDPSEATRFYAYDQDLMISVRTESKNLEVAVQAGLDYDITDNAKLIAAIKKVTHNNLGEFTVRNFDKKIEPKDFSHQSVHESAFGKAFGSIKTSYIPSANAKLIIKHTKGVNEEKRGARSRNIHSLFIENTQGEKFHFPHKYMAGAKAMTKHVNEGGTPYDEKGKQILAVCEEVVDLSKFVMHTRRNKLVSESNNDIVDLVKAKLAESKQVIKSLITNKGYAGFTPVTVKETLEEDDLGVDIAERFPYNTFTESGLDNVLGRVNRLVSETQRITTMNNELFGKLFTMIESKQNLGLQIDKNDPENPNNEDQTKYSGNEGVTAKLSSMLSYIAQRSTNDELSNTVAQLSENVHSMDQNTKMALAKFVNYAMYAPKTESVEKSTAIDAEVTTQLRNKIS